MSADNIMSVVDVTTTFIEKKKNEKIQETTTKTFVFFC